MTGTNALAGTVLSLAEFNGEIELSVHSIQSREELNQSLREPHRPSFQITPPPYLTGGGKGGESL